MTKFSIIVPVYNAELYLSECIQSICAQNYRDFELLLIDDGSTDNSGKICDDYMLNDSRVKVFHQSNRGVSAARNYGIQNSAGEWLLFVDADDLIKQGVLKKLNELTHLYENAEYFCFAYDGVHNVEKVNLNDNREELIMATLKAPQEGSAFAKIPYLASVWNKAFKKNLIVRENLMFSPELIMGEDMIFNIRVQLVSNDIVLIPGNYYYYRENVNSATKGYNPKIPQRDMLFQTKLNELVTQYRLIKVKEHACLRTTLGGILVSCNSCYFKYSIKQYLKYHKDVKEFTKQTIYLNALMRIQQCNNLEVKNKIILYCLKYHLYLLAYVIKKCQGFSYKIKRGK